MAQIDALDTIDRKLLDIIQTAFPLVPRPYEALGRQLGISEEEALDRVKAMKEKRIIRRLGANFQSAKLGFRSHALRSPCARRQARRLHSRRERPARRHPQLPAQPRLQRSGFTLIGPSWDSVCETIRGIEERTGVSIMNLPAEKAVQDPRGIFRMEE